MTTTLSNRAVANLLFSYYPAPTPLLLDQLSIYLELLLKWNGRTNLSAIRDPEEIIRRHFGESLFAARYLPEGKTLLDLGSGAGFPGLPIALAHPHLAVILAESQNKKASFLREVIRTLDLPIEVWPHRVEDLPPERLFDIVAMRAVDNPALALTLARQRLEPGGTIVYLRSLHSIGERSIPLPDTEIGILDFIS
jgi:16S rRNA (guanine527-N7)-methyltransferase